MTSSTESLCFYIDLNPQLALVKPSIDDAPCAFYFGALYFQDSGNCPVTGQPLTAEDLVTLKTNSGVKVRDTKTASLPGLLAAFQVGYAQARLNMLLSCLYVRTHLHIYLSRMCRTSGAGQ